MSGVIAAINLAEAEKTTKASSVVNGAKTILSKWGNIIDTYRGIIPASVVAVRSQIESSGNPKAGPTSQGEVGLLMLWPSTQSTYGVTDPTDPAQNLRGGLLHWLSQLKSMQSALPGYLTSQNYDYWAITQLYTMIGGGATKAVLKAAKVRPGSEYQDLVAWLKQIGEGLESYRSSFGTQSAASVARRIIYAGNMTNWASTIGGLSLGAGGLGTLLLVVGIGYLIYRWKR